MRFLAPLFAMGAALAAVPILLHLFGRDRAPRRAFPAARLLLAIERRRAPRARIEEWLLVFFRTLAVAAIAFVLSRPIWERHEAAPLSVGIRQAAVIVLDDSLSMERRDGRSTLFERARKKARELAHAIADDSEVAVLSTSGEPYDPLPRLERERARVEEALASARGSARAGTTTLALARAAALLASSSLSVRRIYLVTDGAAHGFDPARPRPFDSSPEGVGLSVVRVGDSIPPNDAITSVEVTGAAARVLKVVAHVRADGRPAHTRTISLLIDGHPVARGLVELPTAGAADKHFEYALPKGAEPRWAELALDRDADDSLPLDDRRAATIRGGSGRLLIVDGAPGASRREDETFYVETALKAARGAEGSIDVVTEDELGRTALADVSAILLCNPRASDALSQLTPFVEHGGGLFVSVGDNLDSAQLSSELGALLPSAIDGVRDLAGPGGVSGGALRLGRPAGTILTTLPSLGEERAIDAWRAARSSRVALFRPIASDDAQSSVLASFEDGTPALLERRVGAGRVVALATTVDRAWSDLAIQSVFPAFIVELTEHLSASPTSGSVGTVRAGDRPRLSPPTGTKRLQILAPDAQTLRVTIGDELPRVTLPGAYQVSALDGPNAGPTPQLDYYGELDPTESDPTLLTEDLSTPAPKGASARAPVLELWHALAALLIALLLGEALLGLRG